MRLRRPRPRNPRRTILRTSTAITSSVLTLLVSASARGAQPVAPLKSPGGAVEVAFSLSGEGAPQYSVSFRGRPIVVDSGLGLTLREGGPFAAGFHVVDTRRASRDERYPLVAGKTREGRDHCQELTVALEQDGAKPRRLELVFRAYDDG